MSTPVWRLVAEREIRAQVNSKAFVLGLIASLSLVVVAIVVLGILSGKAPSYDVGVLDAHGKSLAETSKDYLAKDAKVRTTTYAEVRAGEAAVKAGDVDVLLAPKAGGWVLTGDTEVPGELGAALTTAIRNTAVSANAKAQGVDLQALNRGTEVSQRTLSDDKSAANGVFGFAMGLLYYVMALIFGLQIAQAVVQERESRVVEILAAAVPTRALLWGKVLAGTVLALGQTALILTTALVTLWLTDQGHIASGVGPAMAWFLAYFLIGFVALTSLWSAAGTLAGRTQDVNSTTMPMQMVLMAGYFTGAFAGGTVKEVTSLVPIVSPMIMPSRIAEGDVPLWQILLGLLLNVVAAFVLVRIGAGIYDRHLLQTGRKIGFKEALGRPVR